MTIDFQRLIDGPLLLPLILIAVGIAVLFFCAGMMVQVLLRKRTVQDLLREQFGELQRQVLRMASETDHLRRALAERDDRMRAILGYAESQARQAQTAALRFRDLIGGVRKRRTA